MSNDLNLNLRISASATDAIKAFSDLKRSLSEIGAAVTEAQAKTAQLAREFSAAQQQTEALRVQYALGQRTLQELAESAGRTSPQYRALSAEVRQLGTDLRQSEQSTGQAEHAFNSARQRAAQLQGQMESMRTAVHRPRGARLN
jgi:chromosome segregation ATPase